MAELKRELETYRARLASLLADEGKFVVISGDSILGVFVAYEDALRSGYERVGLGPFLVKKIEANETAQFITPSFLIS